MGIVLASGVFIVRSDGKILVGHPTNHASDFWSIPKGKIDKGETTLDAAIRETFEETNINISDFENIEELEAVTYKHKKKRLHPFILSEHNNKNLGWGNFDIKCNSNVPEDRDGFPEMDDFKWVTLDEAKDILHETQTACLDKINEYIKNK